MLRNKVIHEIKRSNKIERAHEWQVKYYIYVLEQNRYRGCFRNFRIPHFADIQPGLHFPITTVQKSRRWRERIEQIVESEDLSTCYQCKNLQKVAVITNFCYVERRRMKKTYYLFKFPVRLQRKTTRCRFPRQMEEDGNGISRKGQPTDTYPWKEYCRVFFTAFRRNSMPTVRFTNFFGAKRNSRPPSSITTKNVIPVSFMPRGRIAFRAKCFLAQTSSPSKTKRSE